MRTPSITALLDLDKCHSEMVWFPVRHFIADPGKLVSPRLRLETSHLQGAAVRRLELAMVASAKVKYAWFPHGRSLKNIE